MTVGILQDIIEKVRTLSASGNSLQVTDEKIIKYINSFYLYDFPDDLRLLKLKDVYTFNTIQGVDVYPFNFDGWSTVEPPAYCGKMQMTFFQDQANFYGYNFNSQQLETFSSGDGTAGAVSGVITAVTQANPAQVTSTAHGLSTGFEVLILSVVGMTELNGNTYTITVVDANNFTLGINSTAFTAYVSGGTWTKFAYNGNTQAFPILKSVNNNAMADTQTSNTSVFPSGYPPTFNENNISRIQNILISANTASSSLHVTDDGAGNLIGDCTSGGTIDYQTGEIVGLTFTSSVPSGNDINIQYLQAVQGQPYVMLFFQNQFVVRPVPDQAYTIEVTGYREPSKALLGTTSNTAPDLNGRPEQFDWWELICFGVAKKLYQDRLDMDGVQMMDAFLQEAISGARTRTYAQIGTRQISTMFRDETTNNNTVGWGAW